MPTEHYPNWASELDSRISDLSDRQEVHLLILGDTGSVDGFSRVAEGVRQQCAVDRCDLAVLLGDNFYIGREYRGPRTKNSRAFERHVYKPLAGIEAGFDLWPVLGNHGYRGCPQAQIDHTYLAPRPGRPDWLMPNQAFAIPKLPEWLHIYGFDSEFLLDRKHFRNSGLDSRKHRRQHFAGIEQAMCGQRGWRILAGHHPIYSTGEHGREKELARLRKHLEPVIEKCGVQFYLSGHDHDQEVIQTDKFSQLIQGAGSTLRSQGPIKLPKKATSLGFWKEYGFGIASFKADTMTLRFFKVPRKGRVQVTTLYSKSWKLSDFNPQ